MLEWIAPQEYTTNSTDDGQDLRLGSEMEVFITSRIPFVNMVGTGLDTGCMKFQLLEHKPNQTVLIPGIPTFFLIFQSKNFLFQKTFLTFVIQTKG